MNENDIIEITEAEYPWVNGTWKAQILKLLEGGDAIVKPLAEESTITWRVRPTQLYFEKGLYITKKDLENSKVVNVQT